ncbi:LacI family DNA-binding transcriptional regulator [Lentzea californiensis]|uniref:LacI family DNA-binding transcriptional regulator n=1 Tax=Lentzea californiensis TaxID=438851 RepID=UPI0021661FD2|nr:LacI family DNA-binding transcriptional regulator [Lentzea californiensis]MCR3750706.1 transcriptional regulator, LacI family [Lentzea californiensis]
MSTVGIKHVAETAGVSTATVSNVLNKPDRVAAATRDRVLKVIKELGFVPNAAARTMVSGRTKAVALVVFDVRNPFLTDVARGCEDTVLAFDNALMLCNSDVSPDKERRYLDLITEQRMQGVLINPVAPTAQWLAELRERGLRVVLLDNVADLPDVCCVAVDDVVGADQAVTHLLGRGHRDIAFVTGPLSMRQSADRRAGCLRALDRAEIPHDALRTVETAAFTVEQGRRAAEQLLASRVRPTAVFCANDLLALGVMQVALRGGLTVPGDLAIVGYDDIDAAETAAVPLTSVHVDGYELGQAAARLLTDEIALGPEHRHERQVFEPKLVERASS